MRPSTSADRPSSAAALPVGALARVPVRRHGQGQPLAERAGGRRAVRLGGVATPLDRRRRPDRAADGAKPAGGQRPRVQRGRAGGGQHLDGVVLPGHVRRLDRWLGAARIRGSDTGIGAQRARRRLRDARHRPAVRTGAAGPQGAAAARWRAGLHRHPARPRLRHLGARKRFGTGLSRPAVVDDGVLVAGAAAAGRPGGPRRSAGEERDEPGVRRVAGVRRGAQRPGPARAGA